MKKRYYMRKRNNLWTVWEWYEGANMIAPIIVARNIEKAWYRLERHIMHSYRSH